MPRHEGVPAVAHSQALQVVWMGVLGVTPGSCRARVWLKLPKVKPTGSQTTKREADTQNHLPTANRPLELLVFLLL